ncbi:hypothetical protein JCGZ_00140 [Jatropha curcas]|uniref:Protein PHLOEM PROTEIN 2-LIKE A9-like n=1 Tax=Jatropha curcas TaxID=180498 RepID=A0A067JJY8_JATCU|nr:protein PHLOEM PROTEIN 2-LIKE A9 [Jatropha curcas]KDP23148.1 hypothetical protein JCGZ_00140 [Jatropha curcas]
MASKPHREANLNAVEKKENKWILGPPALNIVWGNDERYWKLSRDQASAELLQVCWLEVTGSTSENLQKGKSYEIKFKVEMKEGAFGWNGCPVFIMAKIGKKGKYKWEKIDLINLAKDKKGQFEIPVNGLTVEVPATYSGEDTKLYFGLYEVWTGRWKGGLVIHQAEVTMN